VGNYSNAEFTCMTTDHKPTDAIETQRVSEAGGFVALKVTLTSILVKFYLTYFYLTYFYLSYFYLIKLQF
jgi:hypothetical protein